MNLFHTFAAHCITEELCVCVAKIYDLSVYYLNKFGEVNYVY
jgi:hypothetical protein